MDRIPSLLSFLYKTILDMNLMGKIPTLTYPAAATTNTDDSKATIEKLERETENLNKEKLELQALVQSLRDELSSVKSDNERLLLENLNLNESVLTLTGEKNEKSTNILMVEQQVELLSQQSKATEQALRTTFAELKNLKSEYEALEEMYEQQAKDLEESRRIVKSHEIDLCILQKQLEFSREANLAGYSTASRTMSPMSIGSYALSGTMGGENLCVSPVSSTFSSDSNGLNDSTGCFDSPPPKFTPLADITNTFQSPNSCSPSSLGRKRTSTSATKKGQSRWVNHPVHELSF